MYTLGDYFAKKDHVGKELLQYALDIAKLTKMG